MQSFTCQFLPLVFLSILPLQCWSHMYSAPVRGGPHVTPTTPTHLIQPHNGHNLLPFSPVVITPTPFQPTAARRNLGACRHARSSTWWWKGQMVSQSITLSTLPCLVTPYAVNKSTKTSSLLLMLMFTMFSYLAFMFICYCT